MAFSIGSLQRRILGPIVPIVRTQGILNELSVTKLEKSLAKINADRSQAVAVVINSPGGLVAPCQSMVEMLKIFTKKHHLPLYTFAEDMAVSGGYFILVCGDKVYADKTSWVGSIGAITQHFHAQGLLEKYKIHSKTWKTSENLLGMIGDPFADYDEETMNKNLGKLSAYVHEGFIQHVESYRDKKITVPKDQRQEKIYQADIWTGKEAAKLGMVDNLGIYQEVLAREFPDAKLVEVTETSALERMRERLGLAAEAEVTESFSPLNNTTLFTQIINAAKEKQN